MTKDLFIEEIYRFLGDSRTFEQRAAVASCSSLEEDEGWVLKSDIPGYELVAWEHRVMRLLHHHGLCPQVDEEFDITSTYPTTLRMSKINNGATLKEYALFFTVRPNPLWATLLKKVAKKVNLLHSLGWVHGDLHANNIVIEMKGGDFAPCIIDYAFSFHEGGWGEQFRPQQRSKITSPAGDINRLVGDLLLVPGAAVTEYSQAIGELRIALEYS